MNFFTVSTLSIIYLMINDFMQQVYKGNGSDTISGVKKNTHLLLLQAE